MVKLGAMIGKEKYFVYRSSPEAEKKMERFMKATPLYGSKARVGYDGTIFYQRWRQVRKPVSPEEFISLPKRQFSDEFLMREGLKTKDVRAAEIFEFESVKDAIGSVNHVLEGVRGREKEQINVMLSRIRYLRDYFQEHELSAIPEKERAALEEQTVSVFSEVGLDPESVELEVKLLMLLWTVKASRGKDSWNRINEMITYQWLDAAERRGIEWEVSLETHTAPKYAQIQIALTLGEAFDRKVLVEAGGEVERRFLPNVYIEDPERRIAGDYGSTIGKAGTLSWLLEQTKLKPYRPVALEAKGYLDEIKQLLDEGRRGERRRREIHERGLVERLRQTVDLTEEGLFGRTLIEHADL